MTAQVVPFLTQADMFDLQTYKELGFKGVIFAFSLLILVFCVVKGYIKITGCGPNEGGIREFFGITLWKVGPGAHLHIAGIFPVRKVSFAPEQIDLVGSVAREVDTERFTYDYAIDINFRVRNNKKSIELNVYGAADTNRSDAKNGEALRQAGSLAAHLIREIIEERPVAREIAGELKKRWREVELQESFDSEMSTYGYGIKSVDVKKLVERELSEIARAIRGQGPPSAIGAIVSSLAPRSA